MLLSNIAIIIICIYIFLYNIPISKRLYA